MNFVQAKLLDSKDIIIYMIKNKIIYSWNQVEHYIDTFGAMFKCQGFLNILQLKKTINQSTLAEQVVIHSPENRCCFCDFI